jgi:hypothetical protein
MLLIDRSPGKDAGDQLNSGARVEVLCENLSAWDFPTSVAVAATDDEQSVAHSGNQNPTFHIKQGTSP